jgi:hypothetical protein
MAGDTAVRHKSGRRDARGAHETVARSSVALFIHRLTIMNLEPRILHVEGCRNSSAEKIFRFRAHLKWVPELGL